MKKALLITRLLILFISGGAITTAFAQEPAQKLKITSRYDRAALIQKAAMLREKATAEKKAVIEYARKRNIPVFKVETSGVVSELMRILPDGTLIYYKTDNINSAKTARTNFLHTGGALGLNLNGQNMMAHVWDGGHARISHVEYDGFGGNDRVSIGDIGATDQLFIGHATHVTGTIMAAGINPDAKGMAPQAQVVSYTWGNDISEAYLAAADGMLVSNHSYGYDAAYVPDNIFGAYDTTSQQWDELMFQTPYYMMVVSAGNTGQQNHNGQPIFPGVDKLSGMATAKNNLVVANTRDANIDASGELISVQITPSSSQGPTDDLRVKPDIGANGEELLSTYNTSDTDYLSLTGTSMAAPSVSGNLLLFQQYANQLTGSFMKAATLKGLVLHTADDIGNPGPDANMGWGLINAKKAAETLQNSITGSSLVDEQTLIAGFPYTINVYADGSQPLQASISWTDPAGFISTNLNDATPCLVNDLDIRITQLSDTYFPWKVTAATTNGKGDNQVDPYERIDILQPSGLYTITVTSKQPINTDYSLIVTGATVEVPECVASVPTFVSPEADDYNVRIIWSPGVLAAFELQYRLQGTLPWTTVSEINTPYTVLTTLATDTPYEFRVRSTCDGVTFSDFSTIMVYTLPSPYCSPPSNGSVWYISNVSLGNINNTTLPGSGYTYFEDVSTSLDKSDEYTLSISNKYIYGSTSPVFKAAWIDYNRDGDFQDAGEQLFATPIEYTTNKTHTFSIPANASEGYTRLRVALAYNNTGGPCSGYTYGEVEDYKLDIRAAQPCRRPTNLSFTAYQDGTASASWQAPAAGPPPVAWQYAVSVSDSPPASGTTVNTLSVSNITGILADTNYYFFVRSECVPGVFGSWEKVSVFTGYCIPPDPSSPEQSTISGFVTANGFDNIPNTPTVLGSYANLTDTYPVSQVAGGSFDYTIQVTNSTNAEIWIDWNGNYSFEPVERVAYDYNTQNIYTGSIQVPPAATPGNYRMRVRSQFSPLIISSPCGYSDYGSTRDYTVRVINQPSCLKPEGLSLDLQTPTTALAAWTMPMSGDLSEGYEYAVTTYEGTPEYGIFTTNAQANVTVFPGESNYLHVRSSCGGVFSSWATQRFDLFHCTPTPQMSYETGITKVEIGDAAGILNVTEAEQDFYGDFTAMAVSAMQQQDVFFSVTAEGYSASKLSVWVDWNDDYQFDDTTEKIFQQDSDGVSNENNYSGVFSIPANAVVGNHRLRIGASAISENLSPCNASVGHFEDYTVTVLPAGSCFPPVQLNVVSVSATTVNIDWQLTNAGNAAQGFEYLISDSLMPPSSGTSTTATSVSNLTLPAAEIFYLHVRSHCGGIDFSPWTTKTFRNTYCQPAPSFVDGQGITNFTMAEITNSTAAEAGQYGDYSAMIATAGPGENLPFSITLGTNYPYAVNVWVDWNNDFDFDDAAEQVYGGNSNNYEEETLSAIIAVPSNATVGLHRMRIGIQDYNPHPCAQSGTGAFEDYSLQITPVICYTWSGATDADWSKPGNWCGGMIPTASANVIIADVMNDPEILSGTDALSGTLTVEAGAKLTVKTGANLMVSTKLTVHADAELILQNAANLLQFAGQDSNPNEGNITVHRDVQIWRQDYVFWGSPVYGQLLRSFSAGTLANRFYYFDNYYNSFESVFEYQDENSYLFGTAEGYMVRAPNTYQNPVYAQPQLIQTFEGTFTGVPNTGPFEKYVDNNDTTYHLLGNPYPSTMNAEAFIDENPGELYFWTHNSQNPEDSNYASYTSAGGVAAYPGGEIPNGSIQVGQGFFFHNSDSLYTVKFRNDMRTKNNSGQFFRSNAEKNRLWLNLFYGAKPGNQTMIAYSADATLGIDASLDSRRMPEGNGISSLIGSEKFSIQARPSFTNLDVVPLSLHALQPGQFSLSLDHADGILDDENQMIYIKDNYTGVLHNLKESAYEFASAAGDFNDRLQIQYISSTLEVPQENPTNVIIVYKSNGIVTINSGNTEIDDVSVFDMRGRLILSKNGNAQTQMSLNELTAEMQVLLIEITSGNGIKTIKKIVY